MECGVTQGIKQTQQTKEPLSYRGSSEQAGLTELPGQLRAGRAQSAIQYKARPYLLVMAQEFTCVYIFLCKGNEQEVYIVTFSPIAGNILNPLYAVSP